MYERGWRRYGILALFLGPSLLGLAAFTLLPIGASLGISFTNWDLLTQPAFVGFGNYSRLLTDAEFWSTLRNTVTFLVGYVPLVLVTGLLIAVLLNSAIPFRQVFRTLYFVPVVTSWVAVALVWKWLFNPAYGLINSALGSLGISGPAWLFDPNWAMVAVILTSVWKDTGFIMVIMLAGLQGIPREYYEAASIDGATRPQGLWHITIPLLAPTLIFCLSISLIGAFQVFDQVYVMTEGGPAGATMVLVERVVANAFSYSRMGYASAMSWVLFLLIFVVTIFFYRLRKWQA
ncbi:MAG TPA: sugar ABC transporter permease [Trueperaceae bacterium]|nr:sugar ABC transporter permease [Trueperaceae bacterium]